MEEIELMLGPMAQFLNNQRVPTMPDKQSLCRILYYHLQQREANDVTITKDKSANIHTLREEIGKAPEKPHEEEEQNKGRTDNKEIPKPRQKFVAIPALPELLIPLDI